MLKKNIIFEQQGNESDSNSSNGCRSSNISNSRSSSNSSNRPIVVIEAGFIVVLAIVATARIVSLIVSKVAIVVVVAIVAIEARVVAEIAIVAAAPYPAPLSKISPQSHLGGGATH